MTKRVHWKKEAYDVYIGRPSIFGNPYSHKNNTVAKFKVNTREEAVNMFKEFLEKNSELQEKIKILKNKTLGCWCNKNELCHGDVIIDFLHKDSQINLF